MPFVGVLFPAGFNALIYSFLRPSRDTPSKNYFQEEIEERLRRIIFPLLYPLPETHISI